MPYMAAFQNESRGRVNLVRQRLWDDRHDTDSAHRHFRPRSSKGRSVKFSSAKCVRDRSEGMLFISWHWHSMYLVVSGQWLLLISRKLCQASDDGQICTAPNCRKDGKLHKFVLWGLFTREKSPVWGPPAPENIRVESELTHRGLWTRTLPSSFPPIWHKFFVLILLQICASNWFSLTDAPSSILLSHDIVMHSRVSLALQIPLQAISNLTVCLLVTEQLRTHHRCRELRKVIDLLKVFTQKAQSPPTGPRVTDRQRDRNRQGQTDRAIETWVWETDSFFPVESQHDVRRQLVQ